MTSVTQLARLVVGLAVVVAVGALIAVSVQPRSTTPGAASTSEASAVALGSAQPTAAATAGPSATPATSESPDVTATPVGSVQPSPADVAVLARSDAFWRTWIDRPEPMYSFEFATVEDATRQADLVVLGRITDVYVGEYWRFMKGQEPRPLDYVTVTIDQILKGDPVSRNPGAVEIRVGDGDESLVNELRTRLPTEDTLWFVMYEPADQARRGQPQYTSEIAPYAYFLPNPLQAFVRNIGGKVRVIDPPWNANAYPSFPAPLEGTSFEALLRQVRDAAQASSPDPAATASSSP